MGKETILIADDDRVVVEFLSLELRAHGFAVREAADGMQVIMVVRRTPPAAILLDVMMPGGTGLDVLKRLHSNVAMTKIPVLAMSANTDPDLPKRLEQLGADAFLLKPVRPAEVVATLRRLVEKAAQAATLDS